MVITRTIILILSVLIVKNSCIRQGKSYLIKVKDEDPQNNENLEESSGNKAERVYSIEDDITNGNLEFFFVESTHKSKMLLIHPYSKRIWVRL